MAAWSNVNWVIESQFHELGYSPSRTIARRHFNAYHTATSCFAVRTCSSICKLESHARCISHRHICFVVRTCSSSCKLESHAKCFEMVVLSCLTISHHVSRKKCLEMVELSCLTIRHHRLHPMTECVVCFGKAKIIRFISSCY